MPFGSSAPKVNTPAVPAPVPKPGSVELESSKRTLQERLRRAQGRASTQLTPPGTLTLKETLG